MTYQENGTSPSSGSASTTGPSIAQWLQNGRAHRAVYLQEKLVCLLILGFLWVGCSPKEAFLSGAPGHEKLKNESSQYLAYEHTFHLEHPRKTIPQVVERVTEACVGISKDGCSILSSQVAGGDWADGSIRLRVEPQGVAQLIQIASDGGRLTQRKTQAEDLETVIVDGQRRQAMLITYRDRLIELEKSSSTDIESLIKIANEISKVQSDLEALEGQQREHELRIKTEIINFHFRSLDEGSFFRPIRESLQEFTDNLAGAIAGIITASAFLLPWLAILLLIATLVKRPWRKNR